MNAQHAPKNDSRRLAVLSAVSTALRRSAVATPRDPVPNVAVGDGALADEGDAMQQSGVSAEATDEARDEATDYETLAAVFSSELSLLGGKAQIVDDLPACATAIAGVLESIRLATGASGSDTEAGAPLYVAAQSARLPIAAAARTSHPGLKIARDMRIDEIEACHCSLLEATALIADSGSALILTDNACDRTLPYLPRTCIILAAMESLHASLNETSLFALHQVARSKAAGEAVIVTGPSRTADIEKILIAGAHGPAEVHVYIMRNSS